MSISYNPNIPNPPNPPSSDVATMQTNAQAIKTIWAVDHFTFGTGFDGEHLQVTFPNATTPVPTPSGTIGALYSALDVASASELFFVNKTKTSQLTYPVPTNLGNGGSAGGTLYKIPLGFLGITIYAGETTSFSGTKVVTFSTPFTQIISSSVAAQTAGANVTVTAIQNNNSLTIGTSGNVAVNWIAIGVL
jgi:hypothetical protein